MDWCQKQFVTRLQILVPQNTTLTNSIPDLSILYLRNHENTLSLFLERSTFAITGIRTMTEATDDFLELSNIDASNQTTTLAASHTLNEGSRHSKQRHLRVSPEVRT